MPSNTLAERILRFVQAKGYKPQELQQLARAMGIGGDEQGDFHAACKALMRTGRVVLGHRNALMLPEPPGKIIGTFRRNPRGFGFVIPDTPNSHGDLYIAAGATGGAMTGDTVCARVKKRGKRGGRMLYEGHVIDVLSRGQSRFVGELCRPFKRWFVIPDGHALHVPIVVDDAGAKNAKPGDQVVVEISEYPDGRREARGAIVKVLGRRGEPGVDTRSIIEQYQLPGEFEEAVLQDAREAVAACDPTGDAKDREDLRTRTIITIDPPDARDFDDAISVRGHSDGTTELGVHIADVAHFVHEGGPLDREARTRSNSAYLLNTVIPMLPEVISNGACSLQERQPRLTKSVFITYDGKGRVKKTRIANTVIRSAKRLTYEQVSAVLRGKRGRTSARIVTLLKEMERLARLIRARRLREGMLELDLPEVEVVCDQDGVVVDATPADQSFSHKIIEMFMVEANEAVARSLASLGIPYLRRVHDNPGELAGGTLRRFLRVLGHDLPADADRFAIQALLERVSGKPESFAINLAILRSMPQAEYAPAPVGHYALASQNYCHFTSPIRRYPDLTIHRLVDLHLSGAFTKPVTQRRIPTERGLINLGARCNANERRAEAAERELKLVLILRLLAKRLGDEFDGIVTGVANVGVFVQLERYLVEGLLPFDQLIDDWWELDPTHGAVIGQRSGHRITVGDRLKVTVAKVHLPTRQLELALPEPAKEDRPAPRRKRRATVKPTGRVRTRGARRRTKGGRSAGKVSG